MNKDLEEETYGDMVDKNYLPLSVGFGFVAILGNGASGQAAKKLIEQMGGQALVFDKNTPFHILPLAPYSSCVISPGFPVDHPWIQEAHAYGIPVLSEIQLARMLWKGHVIAVTGSNGKSSVVKLITDTLNAHGYKAIACGNYGRPFSDVVATEGENCASTWVVVEVSSFQLETTYDFPSDIGVILNVMPNHLDRHKSFDVYHALKMKLLRRACVRVLPSPDEPANSLKQWHEKWDEVIAESYFDRVCLDQNGFIAAEVLSHVGLTKEQIQEGFQNFEPLPHRMQLFVQANGIQFLDDSKATSLHALCAGVMMCMPNHVHLIAGGLSKNEDPAELCKLRQFYPDVSTNIQKIYLIGRCAKQLYSAWHKSFSCEIYPSLRKATEAAIQNAKLGDCVLLSPGCASFDMFENFEMRGEIFQKIVREIMHIPSPVKSTP